MDYNYLEEVTKDVKDYIKENYEIEDLKDNYDDIDHFKNHIYDGAFISDSVTGNASGSYYCNRYKAEEAICHNWDLIEEMLNSGYLIPYEITSFDPESIDVGIRCYVLGEAIDYALDELGIDDDTFIVDDYEDEYEDEYHHYDSDDRCGDCEYKNDCPLSPYTDMDED